MKYFTKLAKAAVITVGVLAFSSTTAVAKSFKIAVGDSGGSAQHELGKKFVEELEKRTDGRHTARLFLNGQLGSEQDTVNDAAIGTLDFSLLAINNITPFSPTVGVMTLPYVILSLEDAEKLTQGEVGKELT
ncbi:MAG: C4-dicarboxylate ABC transporter substrate-binding protein, partial [Gammaproteobacteria bacterium]|nr:C4-dicarboxylate ABC transporter substrate-binding protein [Gammaproteobacteria bacterium]